jgi:two-component system phosphate regulon sensor histidine kinase PhoR
MVSGWAQSIDQPVPLDGEIMSAIVTNLFNNNPGIHALQFYSLDNKQVLSRYNRNSDLELKFANPPEEKLKNLKEYLSEGNYQKVESVSDGENVQLFFVLRTKPEGTICQLLVNPLEYIEQGLGSQIQQISQDIFYIEIRDTIKNLLVYSTEEIEEVTDNPGSLQSIPLWYIPHHQTGIRLKAKTVKELASERSQQSSLILWGMVLVVIVGLGFVIWNIRKEMKLAELKSEFVANVSHEIRTPLALISMYAETLMLKRVRSEEKQANYLETIHKESNRLTAIVNRILNFSKIEKNKRKYDFRQTDMNKLVASAVESCSSHFQAKQVNCSF